LDKSSEEEFLTITSLVIIPNLQFGRILFKESLIENVILIFWITNPYNLIIEIFNNIYADVFKSSSSGGILEIYMIIKPLNSKTSLMLILIPVPNEEIQLKKVSCSPTILSIMDKIPARNNK